MSTINLQLPEWLEREIRERARRDHVSIDTFIAAALAERVTAMQAADQFARRAARGDRTKYLAALHNVPDVEPDPGDRIDD
jgi:hypothetical protein